MKIILIISILSVMAKVTLAQNDVLRMEYKLIANEGIKRKVDGYLSQLKKLSEDLGKAHDEWTISYLEGTNCLKTSDFVDSSPHLIAIKNMQNKIKNTNIRQDYGFRYQELYDETVKTLDTNINEEIKFGFDTIYYEISSRGALIFDLEKYLMDLAIKKDKSCPKSSVCDVGNFTQDITNVEKLVVTKGNFGEIRATELRLNVISLANKYVVEVITKPLMDSFVYTLKDYLNLA